MHVDDFRQLELREAENVMLAHEAHLTHLQLTQTPTREQDEHYAEGKEMWAALQEMRVEAGTLPQPQQTGTPGVTPADMERMINDAVSRLLVNQPAGSPVATNFGGDDTANDTEQEDNG